MLEISSSAAREIKRIQGNQTQPDISLKLSINSGGCSGLFYELKLENINNASEGDRIVRKINGIDLIVEDNSWQYIENLKIDYAEDLMGGGFRFYNPKAKNVCGCGISFAIAAT